MKSSFNLTKTVSDSVPDDKKTSELKLSGSQVNLSHRDVTPRKGAWIGGRPSSACHRPRPRARGAIPSRRPSSADQGFHIPLPPELRRSTQSLCESIAAHKEAFDDCLGNRRFSEISVCPQAKNIYGPRCNRPLRMETKVDDLPVRDPPLRHGYTAASSRLLQTLLREPWQSDGSELSSSPRSEKSLGCRIKELADDSRQMRKDETDSTEAKDSARTDSTLCLRDLEQKTAVTEINKTNRDAEIDMKFERWFSNNSEKVSQVKGVHFVEETFKTEKQKTDKNNEMCKSPILIDLTEVGGNTMTKLDKYDESPSSIIAEVKNHVPVTPRDSTYEDLVNIISVLEEEQQNDTKHVSTPRNPPPSARLSPSPIFEKDTTHSGKQASEILQYLDEIDRYAEPLWQGSRLHPVASQTKCPPLCVSDVPRMEELLCRSTVDLAQELLSLKLQAEEQAGGIRLLQQTVAELKAAAKEAKAGYQAELDKAANEAEAAVSRHQKMVKQLLTEKKSLNEKVAALVAETKSNEERHQRNLKAMEERHLVEIQRVKETQLAAEKLKREKWIDVKTQKIKEMTVKGLEPELARMASRQQQELAELRNLHRAELEAVELRAARRTSELLDQLRTELARDKEEALQREASNQRNKFEKLLEEEQRRLEDECRRVKDELRREKDRMTVLEAHVQDSLAEAKRNAERERERERACVVREYEDRLEEAHRLHQNELKSLKDALEIEKEVWTNNFKKIQANKMLEREAELHHQYRRDRDRDIEIAIDRLETEATKARLELTEAHEHRLARLRDKLETEVRDAEAETQSLKAKLSETRLQLAAKEDEVAELGLRLRHQQTEFAQMRKLCDEMTNERVDLRKILRQELEDQLMNATASVESIKAEMAELRATHQQELFRRDQLAETAKADAEKEMQHVYSRVRVAISKKDESLESLREQYKVALERCTHLEQMLDNQRRTLLLK